MAAVSHLHGGHPDTALARRPAAQPPGDDHRVPVRTRRMARPDSGSGRRRGDNGPSLFSGVQDRHQGEKVHAGNGPRLIFRLSRSRATSVPERWLSTRALMALLKRGGGSLIYEQVALKKRSLH